MPSSCPDRKSTRLNSSHLVISYAVFLLKSEEHTSELQSPCNLVCRLLLEDKTRQYTLAALMTWRLSFLTPPEQARVERVGSVAGSVGFDAATSVCCGDHFFLDYSGDCLTSPFPQSRLIAD